MEKYEMLSKEELKSIKAALEEEYAKVQHLGLKLDMSRGKPAPAQLDLSMGILDAVSSTSDYKSEDGVDCRNYGVLDGIPEAKHFMADIMGVDASNVIIYGNASLNIMYDTISRFMLEERAAVHLGASLTKLSSCVRYRDMTDILPLPSILALS